MGYATLNLENPVFRQFIGYAALVLVKTCLMSSITAYYRITRKAFINEEDTASFGKKLQVVLNNPQVERVRRCHLNDLENVIPFVLLGLLYVATGPNQAAASLHFRIFTISRYIHTFVYLLVVPQPARALAFAAGLFVNISMVYSILSQASF
ncbi:unnamed protein product [Lymnaea stagnalis]|uniref:Microsomal glutathione S-transferase 1 n=1 Tax=Lymnaea stagnalis TaxID=6523 RepID=A0AAV2HQK6_LYMST